MLSLRCPEDKFWAEGDIMKKPMKRFEQAIAALICVVMLITVTACTGGGGNSETGSAAESGDTSDTQTTGSAEHDIQGSTLIFDGKDTEYIIICSENADSETKDLADSVRNFLSNKTGKKLKCVSDTSTLAESSAGGEILIGKTNRTESTEVYSGLRSGDWVCRTYGDRIVIAGISYAMLKAAADCFEAGIFTTDSGLVYSSANESYNGTYFINSLLSDGVSIGEYTVVYEAGSSSARTTAKRIVQLISNITGYVLEVYDDSTAADGHEILVGKTNRKSSGDVYELLEEEDSGRVRAEGGNIVLAYGNAVSADSIFGMFSSYLTALVGSDDADIGNISLDFSDAYDSQGALQFSVLSLNIWNVYRDSRSAANRDDLAAEVIMSYMPDAFGLQEFDVPFRTADEPFSKLVSEYYTEVICDGVDLEDNWNPIFYRSDKFELLGCGHYAYTYGTEYSYPMISGEMTHFRSFTWAVLRERLTGKTVSVINTHYDTDASNHKSESDELLAKVDELRALYGDNIFVIGDYNCRMSGEATSNMLGYGFSDCYALAGKKNDVSGTHPAPTYNASIGLYDVYDPSFTSSSYLTGAIDHCFVLNSDISVRNYQIITTEDALLISDHCPIWIRAYIK